MRNKLLMSVPLLLSMGILNSWEEPSDDYEIVAALEQSAFVVDNCSEPCHQKMSPPPCGYNEADNNALIEFKAGYFIPWNHTLRNIYHTGGLDLQLAFTQPVSDYLSLYFDVEYVRLTGKSLNFYQRTRLEMAPVTIGLKATSAIYDWMKVYMTIGPRYFFVFQTNYSSYVDHHVRQNGIGGFINGGLLFELVPHFTFNVWVEESYCKLKFHSHKTNVVGNYIQVGGATFGLGLGYSF